jgi:aminopeptidase
LPQLTPDNLSDYAEVLLWALRESRAVPFKNGELVLVRCDIAAMPLAEAVYAALMEAHLHPVLQALPTGPMQAQHYGNSSFGQLTFVQPGLDELHRATSGLITILAPDDLGALAGIDPRSMAQGEKALARADAVLARRRRAGLMGSTVCLFPTGSLARTAGLEPDEYAQRLARACLLLMPEPVAQWKRVKKELADITQWLDGLKIVRLRVEGEGLDLTLSPGAKRRFVGFTGRNIPGFEVYLAPDWRTVSGVFYADQPSIRWGRLVRGARLEFREGVAVEATAEHGGTFLTGRMTVDPGARRVGEFSLTDRRISRVEGFLGHTLLDENLGGAAGNCHIALGGASAASFAGPPGELDAEREDALGFNVSDLHWDLVHTLPRRVTAELSGGGRRALYEDGQFLL